MDGLSLEPNYAAVPLFTAFAFFSTRSLCGARRDTILMVHEMRALLKVARYSRV